MGNRTLPPDTDGMNDQRAGAAKRAVLAFALDFGEMPGSEDDIDLSNLDYTNISETVQSYGDPVGEIDPDILKQNLFDLLADMAHFCDREGITLTDCLRMAQDHYNEETDNKGTQQFFC